MEDHDAVHSTASLPWSADPRAQRLLTQLQIAYPIVLLVLFIAAFTIQSILTARNDNDDTIQSDQLGPGGKPLPKKQKQENKKSQAADFSKTRKVLFIGLQAGVLLSLCGNIGLVIVHALVGREDRWWCGQAPTTRMLTRQIYLIGSFMVYALLQITLIDTKPSPTSAHLITWSVATVMETILLGSSFAVYTHEHRQPKVGDPFGGELEREMTEWEITEVTLDLVRVILLIALSAFYVLFTYLRAVTRRRALSDEEERQGLLAGAHESNGSAEHGGANGYGATNGKPSGPHHEVPAGWEKPKETPSRSWWEYIRAYGMFIPYIWPYKDRKLQVYFVLCFTIVILQRGIQILVPVQAGNITRILAGGHGDIQMPWQAISLYIVFRIFQGSNGLLGAARQVLWIPIEQYSYRELSVAAFEHVHQLSLEFHLGKKTGEVLSALGKGSSLNTFLESITFNVLPMLVDLALAIVYFLIVFDAYYALVIAVVTFWYIYITIRMAAWRADIRRQATNASREEDAVKNDSMTSYETVKYFNAEEYEFNRYRDAVVKYQKAEYL
ncbi:ATP-binding cassette-type vacuolar membrane transporter Hmt1, partial [Oleoguttula sp. CCFEE 5521]